MADFTYFTYLIMKKKQDRVRENSGFEEVKLGEATKKGKRQKEREEEKKKIELRQNSHHQKSSLQYLFQVETDSSKLHQFCIPKKELKTY